VIRLALAVVSNALAVLATLIVPGIEFHGNFGLLLLAGAILGLFNLIVRPVAVLLSLPFLILSLGLFYFVLNGLLLWAASLVIPHYQIHGPLAAILGAVVVALVNWATGALFRRSKSD
jgi:putative membrane protein